MDHKGDTNATIYAGIVIGIIMVIVIALMMYLSRKKVRDQFSFEYQNIRNLVIYISKQATANFMSFFVWLTTKSVENIHLIVLFQ